MQSLVVNIQLTNNKLKENILYAEQLILAGKKEKHSSPPPKSMPTKCFYSLVACYHFRLQIVKVYEIKEKHCAKIMKT